MLFTTNVFINQLHETQCLLFLLKCILNIHIYLITLIKNISNKKKTFVDCIHLIVNYLLNYI